MPVIPPTRVPPIPATLSINWGCGCILFWGRKEKTRSPRAPPRSTDPGALKGGHSGARSLLTASRAWPSCQEGPFSPPPAPVHSPLQVSGLQFPSPGRRPPPPGQSRGPVPHTFPAVWSRRVTAF